MPPCGTPDSMFLDDDRVFPIFTFCDLPVRKLKNQLIAVWSKPYTFNFLQSRSALNVSKAADKSHRRMPVMNLSSVFLVHVCWISERADIVDLPLLKPCWLSGINLFFSIYSVIWQQTIFSSTLDSTIRQLTGPGLYCSNTLKLIVETLIWKFAGLVSMLTFRN